MTGSGPGDRRKQTSQSWTSRDDPQWHSKPGYPGPPSETKLGRKDQRIFRDWDCVTPAGYVVLQERAAAIQKARAEAKSKKK